MASRPTDDRPCARCGCTGAIVGEKYCRDCRKQVLAELKEAGYLTRAYYPRVRRGDDRRQAYDREGGGPWQELAVRAMEGD